MPLRLIFMARRFAVPTLLELVAHAMRLRRSYRRRSPPGAHEAQPTPVEQEAGGSHPRGNAATLKTAERRGIRAHHAEARCGRLCISCRSYSRCAPLAASICTPRAAALAGAAPINRAIMAGDTESA